MRAQRIKCPMGALTAEGVLIYDENVSGKRLGTSALARFGGGYVGSHAKRRKRIRNDGQVIEANPRSLIGHGSA
jgi:hypothetical protein